MLAQHHEDNKPVIGIRPKERKISEVYNLLEAQFKLMTGVVPEDANCKKVDL